MKNTQNKNKINVGRSRIPVFKSSVQLQKLVDEFFRSCDGVIRLDDDGVPVSDKSGNPVIDNQKPPTVSALAFALGFHSRRDLLNYNGKASHMRIIERAMLRIEKYAEAKLFDKYSSTGAKFSLSNNFKDWNDKHDDSSVDALVKLDNILAKLSEVMCKND